MPPRFFVPEIDPHARVIPLPAEEAAHLGRVLRLEPGARVSVFDGRGHEWDAEVAEVGRRHATVTLKAARTTAPEPRVPITLLLSVLKGEKMDDVVRDAVMLGAAAVRPIVSTRTEVSLSALTRGARAERWRRIAVASAKQCGRAVVPAIHEPETLESSLGRATAGARLVLVEPNAAGVEVRQLRDLAQPAAAELIVGPEGGWTGDELARIGAAGGIGLRLGDRTLRADAVPLVAITALQAMWGDL
jgi:16S rRNA (uracil1498-N3)-methyltransferase